MDQMILANGELERICKEEAMAYLRYCQMIYLDGDQNHEKQQS
jgi:hypothetical protein